MKCSALASASGAGPDSASGSGSGSRRISGPSSAGLSGTTSRAAPPSPAQRHRISARDTASSSSALSCCHLKSGQSGVLGDQHVPSCQVDISQMRYLLHYKVVLSK